MKRYLLLLAATILAAGCASNPPANQAETGSTPSNKTILVKADSENNHTIMVGLDKRLYITHVDDESTNTVCFQWPNCYAEEVKVSPGRHYLKLKFAQYNSFAEGKIWFDAEEGKDYAVRRRISGYGVKFWVEEAATGRVVGGLPGAEPEAQK